MFSTSQIKQEKPSLDWPFWLLTATFIAGLLLSCLSWLELCVEHCSANQDYRLFGVPFAPFGLAFFTLLIALHFYSKRHQTCGKLIEWMIFSALGAEAVFIYVQHAQIGHWCPVCLSIAACVAFSALILICGWIRDFQKHRGDMMHFLKRMTVNLSFLLVGLFIALIGIGKVDSAQAAINDIRDKVAFGTKGSQIEVYFFSDWFCPSCKKVESLIEKTYPKIKSKVVFYFIDYPIHRKSMNFSPYNLAFLINDKADYFKARQMLLALADKSDSPTDEDVEKQAKKAGLKFKELSYLEVKTGMEFFDSMVAKYGLSSTPTIVIVNSKKNSVVKLEGRDEISEEKIIQAVDKLTAAK